MEIELYCIIRTVQYGIPTSRFHFFYLLKLYNPNINTFFTPLGELGLALHEIFEVLRLPIEKISYKEYVPIGEE